MPIETLSLIGAGGHAAVVADAVALSGSAVKTIYSEDYRQVGQILLGCTIDLLDAAMPLGPFHVAVGDNRARARLYVMLERQANLAATIIHPSAVTAISAEIGPGSFVAAGAVLAPRSSIGKGVIVNHRAVVDHDASVGDYSHIAPGVTLGGNACIGEHVLVGAGAIILPGVTVGAGATIGAGAVVTVDIPADQTAVGVPARLISRGN